MRNPETPTYSQPQILVAKSIGNLGFKITIVSIRYPQPVHAPAVPHTEGIASNMDPFIAWGDATMSLDPKEEKTAFERGLVNKTFSLRCPLLLLMGRIAA